MIRRLSVPALLVLPLVLAASASASGCTRDAGRGLTGPPPLLPEPHGARRVTPAPEWYWEPVEPPVRAPSHPVELPVAEGSIERTEGAAKVWESLGAAGRDQLLRDGLVTREAPAAASFQMGAFYMDLREQRVPYVVTLDALAAVLHAGYVRALAEVDDTVIAPALVALLERLDARLAAESKGAGVELAAALGTARAMVAVARGLATEGAVVEPPLPMEEALRASQEITRVLAHAGVETSPLLGAPIDYATLVAPEGAAHPGAFRALAWLSSAPLLFVPRSEARGGVVDVGTARRHARVALLFARLTQREVDPAIEALYTRLTRLLAFLWGPSDDLTPGQLAEIAAQNKLKVEDPKLVSNVVLLDRLRKKVATSAAGPALFDGSGAPGRAGIGLRLFGGHAAADSVALATLAGPALGVAEGGTMPALAREGQRLLPASLDLAAWLGAKEGRAALRADRLDVFPGYDAALARAIAARPDDLAPSRHASVHGSLLDVTMTWLTPEPAPARLLAGAAAQRAAIESALAAWTLARHESQPLTRPLPPRSARFPKEVEARGAALPAFVEQAPDVIAGMVATVAQTRRGLAVVAGLPLTSPAMTTLVEVEDLLRTAMRIATLESNDEALPASEVAALQQLPARLARLDEGNAPLPVVAEVAVDPGGARSLSAATGALEQAITVVRDPGSGDLVLAVGAHVPAMDLVESRASRSTDASHRARLARARGDGRDAPARGSYTNAFRLPR
ncbi:MAG: hypothetical protein JWP97_2599 [Labilithrix sp.]|nr:hypothetical protein [Labilithrix sp.]